MGTSFHNPFSQGEAMTGDTHAPSSWWGEFSLNIGQSQQWQIGPLNLIVRRLSGEWQIAHERRDESGDNGVSWQTKDTDQLPESLDNNSRYVFRDSTGRLSIIPLLADRPVISRPLTPFNLAAGEEVTLYVSTPLWLELAVGASTKKHWNQLLFSDHRTPGLALQPWKANSAMHQPPTAG